VGVEFTPEDQAPDPDFPIVGRNARLAAHYHRTLKDNGLCEYEAVELTREWIQGAFSHEPE
jgi:hypothetical protein